ncbi:GreA/GreB family elongation factor [Mycobacterium asiaticum]|uniref:Transcription elongation factor GreA/GreB C-terminal domain-containing protein n=1 Tax=Mycobacterium asiaticum TaxID=1790 RepID=A0A1A3KIV0_MYCAS|nr:GreA/GreB family elongation factor [Mycobacterium asiaticum]OBJ84328.1 hypothetical protein A5640_16515 [Mycobacterium asiaticum]ORA10719.1 hypothetical protein BST16_21480 [Mycobacterium asiaticum DSM 44297]
MTAAQRVPAQTEVAEPGTVLTVRYDRSGRTETFMLGGYGACDTDRKLYPLRSPIGRAIVGARPGDQRQVVLSGSEPIPVTLIDVDVGGR